MKPLVSGSHGAGAAAPQGDDHSRTGFWTLTLGSIGVAQGSNVRVGLEDSLWIEPGKLAESSAAQVRKIRQVIEGLSLDIATPAEAREMLALKGASDTNF